MTTYSNSKLFEPIGRGLIAEPDLALKAHRKENGRITPCIYCNHCLDWAGFGHYLPRDPQVKHIV